MPFINTKTSAEISKEQEIQLKEKMGSAIKLIGKSESWLMLNFEDKCRMAFKGNADSDSAIVSVDLLGGASEKAYADMTHAICTTVSYVLGVPFNRVYVKYGEYTHWGYAGENF